MKKLPILLLTCTLLAGGMAFNSSKTVLAADNSVSNNASATNKVITTMSSSFYHGEPMLQVGSESNPANDYYIKDLQRKLTDLGYNVGGVDGIFGEKTRQAVEKFQENYNLSVDCQVGPKTWAKLNEVHWNWRNSYSR